MQVYVRQHFGAQRHLVAVAASGVCLTNVSHVRSHAPWYHGKLNPKIGLHGVKIRLNAYKTKT